METSRPAPSAFPGLNRSDPRGPGITRVRTDDGFGYREPSGADVTDPATLRRIRALVLPPAWTDVWISPDPLGHIQATGVDSRGRTQYRYHELWREQRDAQKFTHMLRFAAALPALTLRRARVQLFGSGFGGPAPLSDAAAAFEQVLALVSAGEIDLATEAVPLAEVTKAWNAPGDGRRIVFVP